MVDTARAPEVCARGNHEHAYSGWFVEAGIREFVTPLPTVALTENSEVVMGKRFTRQAAIGEQGMALIDYKRWERDAPRDRR